MSILVRACSGFECVKAQQSGVCQCVSVCVFVCVKVPASAFMVEVPARLCASIGVRVNDGASMLFVQINAHHSWSCSRCV